MSSSSSSLHTTFIIRFVILSTYSPSSFFLYSFLFFFIFFAFILFILIFFSIYSFVSHIFSAFDWLFCHFFFLLNHFTLTFSLPSHYPFLSFLSSLLLPPLLHLLFCLFFFSLFHTHQFSSTHHFYLFFCQLIHFPHRINKIYCQSHLYP